MTLIELMVCLLVAALVSIGISKSSVLSLRLASKTRHDSAGVQLAMEKLEEFGAMDPQFLDETKSAVETEVIRQGMSFSRMVDVTINSDRSRQITVTVQALRGHGDSEPVTLADTFALWGER